MVEQEKGEGTVEEVGFRIKSLLSKKIPEVNYPDKLRLLILTSKGSVISGGKYVEEVILPGPLRVNATSVPGDHCCIDSGFSRYYYTQYNKTQTIYGRWEEAGISLKELDLKDVKKSSVGRSYRALTANGASQICLAGFLPLQIGPYGRRWEALEPTTDMLVDSLTGEALLDELSLCTMRPALPNKKFLSVFESPNMPLVESLTDRRDVMQINVLGYLEDFAGMQRVAKRVKKGEDFDVVFGLWMAEMYKERNRVGMRFLGSC